MFARSLHTDFLSTPHISQSLVIDSSAPCSAPVVVLPRKSHVEYSIEHQGEHFYTLTNEVREDADWTFQREERVREREGAEEERCLRRGLYSRERANVGESERETRD